MNLFEKSIKEFNQADFFAAHDSFEELWFNSTGKDKLFLQGLVQISVGFYHLICKNYKGSLSQLSKGTQKLKDYSPFYKMIEVDKLLFDVQKVIKILSENKNEKDIIISLKLIPKIIIRK